MWVLHVQKYLGGGSYPNSSAHRALPAVASALQVHPSGGTRISSCYSPGDPSLRAPAGPVMDSFRRFVSKTHGGQKTSMTYKYLLDPLGVTDADFNIVALHGSFAKFAAAFRDPRRLAGIPLPS